MLVTAATNVPPYRPYKKAVQGQMCVIRYLDFEENTPEQLSKKKIPQDGYHC